MIPFPLPSRSDHECSPEQRKRSMLDLLSEQPAKRAKTELSCAPRLLPDGDPIFGETVCLPRLKFLAFPSELPLRDVRAHLSDRLTCESSDPCCLPRDWTSFALSTKVPTVVTATSASWWKCTTAYSGEMLGDVVKDVLPHVGPDMVRSLWANSHPVSWTTRVVFEPMLMLTVHFVTAIRRFVMSSCDLQGSISVDATWTCADIKAHVAALAGARVGLLHVTVQDRVVRDDEWPITWPPDQPIVCTHGVPAAQQPVLPPNLVLAHGLEGTFQVLAVHPFKSKTVPMKVHPKWDLCLLKLRTAKTLDLPEATFKCCINGKVCEDVGQLFPGAVIRCKPIHLPGQGRCCPESPCQSSRPEDCEHSPSSDALCANTAAPRVHFVRTEVECMSVSSVDDHITAPCQNDGPGLTPGFGTVSNQVHQPTLHHELPFAPIRIACLVVLCAWYLARYGSTCASATNPGEPPCGWVFWCTYAVVAIPAVLCIACAYHGTLLLCAPIGQILGEAWHRLGHFGLSTIQVCCRLWCRPRVSRWHATHHCEPTYQVRQSFRKLYIATSWSDACVQPFGLQWKKTSLSVLAVLTSCAAAFLPAAVLPAVVLCVVVCVVFRGLANALCLRGFHHVDLEVAMPHQSVPRTIRVRADATVGELRAMLSSLYGLPLRACQPWCNAKPVKDTIQCRFFTNSVLRFRAFPLLGGGQKDGDAAVKEGVAKLLLEHGVPADAIASRSKQVVDAIGLDLLRGILKSTNPWQDLKDKASEHKVRLVHVQELRVHQQSKKTQPAESNNRQKRTREPRKGGAPISLIDPSVVVVKPDLFNLENRSSLVARQASRFPNDGPGLYVMGWSQLQAFMPPSPLSVDAMLVVCVTQFEHRYTDRVHHCDLPAVHGETPIILRASVVNFGEVKYDLKLQCAQTHLDMPATTCIEIKLLKEHTDVLWQNIAMDPMSVVTKAIRALRPQGSILRSWSKAFFAPDRKRIPPSDPGASYFLAYAQVLDSVLDDSLRDSGTNGVFLCPRSPERTKDHRFRVLQIQAKTLAEARGVSLKLEQALGVVITAQGFGIMSRAEAFANIKLALDPEAYVMQSLPDFTSFWNVTGLPPSVSPEHVGQAFERLGWKGARAIRPLGISMWLVGATSEPPASHFMMGQHIIAAAKALGNRNTVHDSRGSQQRLLGPVAPLPLMPNQAQSSVPAPAAGRIDQIRTELISMVKSEVQASVGQAIQAEVQQVNTRVETCEAAITQVVAQNQELTAKATAQAAGLAELSVKVVTLDSNVTAANTAMLTRIQEMFQKADDTLQKRLGGLEKAVSEREVRRKTSDES